MTGTNQHRYPPDETAGTLSPAADLGQSWGHPPQVVYAPGKTVWIRDAIVAYSGPVVRQGLGKSDRFRWQATDVKADGGTDR